MNSVWKVILDNEFIQAYKHGFVVEYLDGRSQWFSPWIFTYSADYPEKCTSCPSYILGMLNISIHRILLASIQDKGLCPCPCCHTPKADFHKLDQVTDFAFQIKKAQMYIGNVNWNACNWIYSASLGITSAAVEYILKPESWTPTLVRACNESCDYIVD